MSTAYDISKARWHRYALDVVGGKVVACRFVKQACQRYLDDLNDDRLELRIDRIAHAVRFIRMLQHFSGAANGKPFILEPWQLFIVANIVGWYWKGTGKRRYNEAYVSIARKNGKTALFAALMIYFLLADGEPDATVLISANSREQATRVDFQMVKGFLQKLDPRGKTVKAQRNQVKVAKTTNMMYVTASDASKLDGYNISACLVDEYHEADTSEVKDVLKTAMGNRRNPLQCVVTTRGFDMSKPCYALDQYAQQVLSGEKKDDALFAMIFTLDEDDDWRNPRVWAKANPNLGITVSQHYIAGELSKALATTTDEINYRTKLMNQWVESKTIWISDDRIVAAMSELTWERFRDYPCYIGLDLSSVSDITSVSYLWVIDGRYYFKVVNYLPSDALATKENSIKYREFDLRGDMVIFPDSNVTDYDRILEDIKGVNDISPVQLISYDKWNSTQMIINATNYGFNCQPYAQSLSSFNRPTKEFERLMLQGNAEIDRNECTRWAFRNVLIKTDAHENQQLIKATNMSKIDPAVSMMMALGGYLTNFVGEFSGI
jgi:phage terminase large subunit-like protein